MPTLTATVSSTMLTASTSVSATPTTSSRQTSTTSKKPILSAGLSPTLSSNLAALFPSQAEKFAVPGNFPASSFSSSVGSPSDGPALAKVQHSAKQHSVVVTPTKGSVVSKSVVVAPGLSTDRKANKKGDSSGVASNTIPIITALSASTKKGVVAGFGGTPIIIDPSSIGMAGAAAHLKAGQAKALHGGSAIQHVALNRDLLSPDRLPASMQGLSFDFTQFMMPRVLDVLTVGAATKLGKKAVSGKGGESTDPVPILKMMNSGLGKTVCVFLL